MKYSLLISPMYACLLGMSSVSNAAQFTFDNSINGGVSGSYMGPGIENAYFGGVLDGGRVVFDGYGGVPELAGLDFFRHTLWR